MLEKKIQSVRAIDIAIEIEIKTVLTGSQLKNWSDGVQQFNALYFTVNLPVNLGQVKYYQQSSRYTKYWAVIKHHSVLSQNDQCCLRGW